MIRLAVVLFNLGGPDSPAAVKPFLFNLFNDPAIIGVPQPIRWLLAKLISGRRAPVAREIYAHLGGGSPLVPQTMAQAEALRAALTDETTDVRVFPAMRYWHPLVEDVARDVAAFDPDEVVLLPLYPQFSTTTTGSSLTAWSATAAGKALAGCTRTVCCYPAMPGWVAYYAQAIREERAKLALDQPFRVLFSAHGLPEKIVAAGDPYPDQVIHGATAIAEAADLASDQWQVTYQSRVGPLKWIGPETEAEIRAAGEEGTALIIVPIAFVSEHSETLVELDIEYRQVATDAGVPAYHRVMTPQADPGYIADLAAMVTKSGEILSNPCTGEAGYTCPASGSTCPRVLRKAGKGA